MTFFENSQHFSIHGAQMNDVKGNYTRNETRTVANNTDSYNQYIASMVAKGNTEAWNTTIEGTHNHNIAFGNKRMVVGATMTGLTPDVAALLQNLPLPNGMPNISGVTTQTSTQRVSQSYAPTSRSAKPPVVSKSLAYLEGIPADSWTPEMLAALSKFVTTIESATQGKRRH